MDPRVGQTDPHRRQLLLPYCILVDKSRHRRSSAAEGDKKDHHNCHTVAHCNSLRTAVSHSIGCLVE